jgi:serine/threonine protein kinase
MLVDDIILIKSIGRGTFGEVYLTSKQGVLKKYATKVIEKSKYNSPKKMKYLTNEITILKDINHPNIVKFVEIHETSKKIYIVTELCNGGNLSNNLENYMEKNNIAFSEEIVQYIMKQIIEGVKYLHNKKIIHRQLSLDNIMLDYEDENDKINNNIMKGKIKIIDFSFARYLKKGDLAYSISGCQINMSPIILNKINNHQNYKYIGYNEKEDIWSLGCICYELLTGHFPFDSDNMKELLEKVNKGDYYIPITLSKEAVSFLNCMLQFEPKNRLSPDDLYNHSFLRKNVKEFGKIDINGLKNIEIIDNSKIKVNINNNKTIFENFGN